MYNFYQRWFYIHYVVVKRNRPAHSYFFRKNSMATTHKGKYQSYNHFPNFAAAVIVVVLQFSTPA